MKSPIPATALLLASLLSTAPVGAEVMLYRGLCNASAAVAIGPRNFVVADDDLDVLSIYEYGKPDAILPGVDLIDYLGNRQPDGKLKEADIEGAARVGNRIYWIASHARNTKGKVQEARQRFFATEVVDTAAGPTVKALSTPPYKGLLRDLLADPRFALLAEASALQTAPEDPGGLNIEGLAATREGQLLIGFRNPLPKGKALLLPLRNPAEVIDKAAAPVFGDLIALDLGERGIRSIEWVDSRFLIVAGPFDNGKGSGKGFALYTWTGRVADSPQRIKQIDFGNMHPEALFAATGDRTIHILSDDGNAACKKGDLAAARKTFRDLVLSLPDLVR
jgi:hypothetical protein